jgi:DCN1-like protein 1/2
MACAFWGLLLPHGLEGGALSHEFSSEDDSDHPMGDEAEVGWRPEYNQIWFDYLNERGGKGVSKDTWMMVRYSLAGARIQALCAPKLPEFIRSIDSKFATHDETSESTLRLFISGWLTKRKGSWPSTIDDFVEYAKEKNLVY